MFVEDDYFQQDADIFPGFYDTFLGEVYLDYPCEDGYYVDFREGSFEDYKKKVCESFVYELFQQIPEEHGILKSITFKELNSPKEYNFLTDRLVCRVTVDKEKLRDYCYKDNLEEFKVYLGRYKTRDGFISFVPQEIDEFKDSIHELDIILDFYIVKETSPHTALYYDLSISEIQDGFLCIVDEEGREFDFYYDEVSEKFKPYYGEKNAG